MRNLCAHRSTSPPPRKVEIPSVSSQTSPTPNDSIPSKILDNNKEKTDEKLSNVVEELSTSTTSPQDAFNELALKIKFNGEIKLPQNVHLWDILLKFKSTKSFFDLKFPNLYSTLKEKAKLIFQSMKIKQKLRKSMEFTPKESVLESFERDLHRALPQGNRFIEDPLGARQSFLWILSCVYLFELGVHDVKKKENFIMSWWNKSFRKGKIKVFDGILGFDQSFEKIIAYMMCEKPYFTEEKIFFYAIQMLFGKSKLREFLGDDTLFKIIREICLEQVGKHLGDVKNVIEDEKLNILNLILKDISIFFISFVPLETSKKLLDLFMLEGIAPLIRFIVGFFEHHKKHFKKYHEKDSDSLIHPLRYVKNKLSELKVKDVVEMSNSIEFNERDFEKEKLNYIIKENKKRFDVKLSIKNGFGSLKSSANSLNWKMIKRFNSVKFGEKKWIVQKKKKNGNGKDVK